MKVSLAIATLLLLAWGAFAWATAPEKAKMSPEALQKVATHIVIGKVQRVYTYQEKKDGYRYTHFLAEILPEKQEKGPKIDLQSPVYVRYFHRQDTRDRVGGSGHYGYRPEQGDRVRAYVARKAYDGWHQAKDNQDGGFNVIPPNGFEKLPERPEQEAPQESR